jgi:hypothetical protein
VRAVEVSPHGGSQTLASSGITAPELGVQVQQIKTQDACILLNNLCAHPGTSLLVF